MKKIKDFVLNTIMYFKAKILLWKLKRATKRLLKKLGDPLDEIDICDENDEVITTIKL